MNNFFPFFIDMEFEGLDAPTPFTEVKSVELAYISPDNTLSVDRFSDPCDWHGVGEWIRGFRKLGNVAPVGYDLRNLVWPALTANLARAGEPLPGMMLPMEQKWNRMEMVDLMQLPLQGGYSDFKPSRKETLAFFGIPDGSGTMPLFQLFKAYQRVS